MKDNDYLDNVDLNNFDGIKELINEVKALRLSNYVLKQNILYYHRLVKEHINLEELYENGGLHISNN
jgi:hypothetical protein